MHAYLHFALRSFRRAITYRVPAETAPTVISRVLSDFAVEYPAARRRPPLASAVDVGR